MKSIYEFLLKSKTSISTQDKDYVDLGLPSGLLWATCNIGAGESTEYGDYFMWGSTELDTDKSCRTKCMPFNNGSDDYDEEYFESIKNKVCPNGILAPKYDAATVILGDGWRLPTDNEFQELIDNTEQNWIKNYQGSGIKGMLFTPVVFTAKNDEAAKANEAELFIPASGYRSGSNFYSQGISVYLWSSSLIASSTYYARNLHLSPSSCCTNSNSRCIGFCLRSVKNK